MTKQFTNYKMDYYLEGTDITNLLSNYREAYKQKFQQQFEDASAPVLTQLDNSFYHNQAGELIFYAGEVAILDPSRQKADQTLGKNLRNAELAIVNKLLALNISQLPFDSVHIVALMNWSRGHWTSSVLSLKNINKEKYAEIYQKHEAFKKWANEKKGHTQLALKSSLTEKQPGTLYFEACHSGAIFPLSELSKNANHLPCKDEVFVSIHKEGDKTQLKYTVLDPKNKTKTVEGFLDLAVEHNLELTLPTLQKLKPLILAETSKKGLTSAAQLKYTNIDDKGMPYEGLLSITLEEALTDAFLQKNKNTILDQILSLNSSSQIDAFVRYAVGYYDEKAFSKKYIANWIEAFFKERAEESVHNGLKLILEPEKQDGSLLIHFDSMPSNSCHENTKELSKDFLEANKLKLFAQSNKTPQSGATCGEHAVINAFRYAFLNLTNVVNSDHLRTATNYFCPEFARLFLFDYDRETFRETYDCILACQQAKELKSIPNQPPVSESTSASATVPPVAPDKSIGIKATEPPVEIKTKEEPTSPGVYLAMGILSGAAIALLSVGVLAPMFALTSPFSILVLTGGVALISAGVACVVVDQEEITQTFTFSAEAEPAFPAPSEEERQLREHSLKTLNQQQNPNLSSPPKPKTVTSKADATAALSEEEKQLRERSLKQLDQHQHADLPAPSKTFTPNVDATAAAAQGAKQTVVNEPLKQPTEPVKKPAA